MAQQDSVLLARVRELEFEVLLLRQEINELRVAAGPVVARNQLLQLLLPSCGIGPAILFEPWKEADELDVGISLACVWPQ